jgi:hypothetical protein
MRGRTARSGMKCEEALGMPMQGDPADFIATWDFKLRFAMFILVSDYLRE